MSSYVYMYVIFFIKGASGNPNIDYSLMKVIITVILYEEYFNCFNGD